MPYILLDNDLYRQWIYGMADLKTINRQSIDCAVRRLANELAEKIDPEVKDVFCNLPPFFLDKTRAQKSGVKTEQNVLIDPAKGRRIVFDTIHGVKGETHDATLYLETERNRGSDLGRCITFIESKNMNKCNSLTKYSRKLAYVGMSRPQKLLCIAMKKETYGKGKTVFDKYCDVIHI